MTVQEIKDYMKKNKITQVELAEKSKLPLQTIRHIFCGLVKNPRIDTMQAIEKALELDKKRSLVQKLEHRPGVQKIIEESEKFTELGLAAILGMIIMLAKEHPEYLIKY